MEAFSPLLGAVAGLLLLTSFVKVLTTLSTLSYGLGLQNASFQIALVGVSLALTLLVVSPQLDKAGGIDGLFGGNRQSAAEVESAFRPFVEKHADPALVERFAKLSERLKEEEAGSQSAVTGSSPAEPQEPASAPKSESQLKKHPFPGLLTAFLISQLKEAFQLGFVFLVPLLIIDLLITNILMVLGITQIPHAVISLPFKLLLFIAIDGWTLIADKLVSGYL